MDLELEQGEYVIVPRTTGCNLRKPEGIKIEKIPQLLTASGDFHPLVELMLKDLFRKLDKLTIDNCLDYTEFRTLYQRLNLKLTEDDYNRNILRVYSPSYP